MKTWCPGRLVRCSVSLWWVALVLAWVPIGWVAPVRTSAAAGPVLEDRVESMVLSEIHVSEGKLWVDVKGYPADGLFAQVGKAAGFEVLMDRSYAEKSLTVRFNGVALEEAISRLVRLLNTRNYRLAYRDDGSVDRLEIFKSLLVRGAASDTGAGSRAANEAPSLRQAVRRAPGRPARSEPPKRREPVRRRVVPLPDELTEEDAWIDQDFADEEASWEGQEEPLDGVDEEVPFLAPVQDLQRLR